jgi:hypothetical protein
MSTPESLLKMESLDAVKQVLLDNLPSWVKKEWLVIEGIRPKAPSSKDALAEMTFSSFYAPPAISAKFKDPLTFQFKRLNLTEFLTGVDKTVKFKGSVSSVDILSRLLAKHEIPVSPTDVELFTTEAAGSYVITAPASSPRWVGSVTLQLVREAYLLKEFFSNTAIFIPFSASFRSDDFLKVLLKAIENHNSSYEEPYQLRPEDFRITSGPSVITADDSGLNTKITLTGVGGDFTGSMDFTYQRKSYTPTYRHPVRVATGGVVTRAKVLDAINFKYDTCLVESDIANWASLPSNLVEKGTYRLISTTNSLTTVGDIYVELVIWDESNQIDLATEIFDNVMDGFVLTHNCKMPLELVAPKLDGFTPPFPRPDITTCTTKPYLTGFTSIKKQILSEFTRTPFIVGFTSIKGKPVSEWTPEPYLDGFSTEKKRPLSDEFHQSKQDGFDSDKVYLLSEVLGKKSQDGFESDKRRPLSQVLEITALDGWTSNLTLKLSQVLHTTSQSGFESDKKKPLANDLPVTEQDGFDSDKLKLLPEVIDVPALDGFESDKRYLLSELVTEHALDGYDSDKLKLLTEVIVSTIQDGFESDKQYLLSEQIPTPKLGGYESGKLKLLSEALPRTWQDGFAGKEKRRLDEVLWIKKLGGYETIHLKKKLSEVLAPRLDGFEGKTSSDVDLTNVIVNNTPAGLNFPPPPVPPTP